MSTIQKLLNSATVAESCDVAITAAKLISKPSIDDTYLKGLTKNLGSIGDQMVKSIATDRKKNLSEEVSYADTNRDNDYDALKGFVKAYITWNNPKYKQSATRLFSILKNHGLDLAKKGYEEESSLLDSLLNELHKKEIESDVALLKLEEQIESLEESQQTFKKLYQRSLEGEAAKENIIAASKLKKEVFSILNEIIDYLNTMSKARPAIYGNAAGEVAELTANMNQKIRNRRNRKDENGRKDE